MNHFLGLVLLSICVATVFALINKHETEERVRYFLTLMAYMVLGSFLASWVMYLLPW